eukprot:scaffold22648_cov114-Cylindrotheca_fusiformis.AAC.4
MSSDSLEPPPGEEEKEPEDDDEKTVQTGQAEPRQSRTNVDSRLLQAQQSFKNNDRLSSADLGPLRSKFGAFRQRLDRLVPLIKGYQEAKRDMISARTNIYKDIASISIETPLYEHVGKPLDSTEVASITTLEEAMEYADRSGIQSLMSVDQLALIAHRSLEKTCWETMVDYVIEWERIVAKKVDSMMKFTTKLGKDREHYEKKVSKLQEGKMRTESNGKEFTPKKQGRMERNERKLKDATQVHEKQAAELCHVMEQIVEHCWEDLLPLVENTVKWELTEFENDVSTYATALPSILELVDQEVSRLKAEEEDDDLEAALSLQRERNEALKQKLDKIKVALKGDWNTKTELFHTLSMA